MSLEKKSEKVIKLSVAIICFNEQQNIKRCLEAVSKVADEIVVVDSFSTDKTKDICQLFDVNFLENSFIGHIEQKNYALEKCRGEYVLSVDADEVLSDELIESILKVKQSFSEEGYRFHRLTRYVDQWIYHCGWYPDTKLRLVKKKSASWVGTNPHDILELKSKEKGLLLPGDLFHYSYDSISDHINQTNKFTTIAAHAAFNKGVRSSFFKVVTRPVLKFLRDYFWKRGFLDGQYGFVICIINGLSAFLKYAKVRELQNGKTID